MKITIDNYKDLFTNLNYRLSQLEHSGNQKADETLARIKEKMDEMCHGGDALREANGILKIGIVGQVKAGKSSFLNSLFFNGENVLPKASTPMTAGLTILQYGEQNEFEVEYYNSHEWKAFEDKSKMYDTIIEEYKAENPSLTENDIIKMADIDPQIIAAKELVSNCSRNVRINIQEKSKKEVKSFSNIIDLQQTLERYVGANGDHTSIVKCLSIKLHDERLRNIQIVDTPGVNDPVLSREQRTREFLRECHGVFFLSYSGRFFDSTDVSFLTERIGSQGIGEVILIGSKFDSVLQDVGMKYKDELPDAINYCQNALKKQYERNISTSNFCGKDPLLDFSSGIGFSISQKEENHWDEMERHVVKQMRTFYPSFFNTIQEIKETFGDLSQINDIREKYVEQIFKSKKDKIIQNKINAYFNNTSSNLKKIIEGERNKLTIHIEMLRESDIEEIGQKRQALLGIISHIKGDLGSIANRMDDKIQQTEKECLNEFHFDWNDHIPTARVSATFQREGTILGIEKHFQCEYDKVNLSRLISNICGDLDNALNQLSNNWNKKVGSVKTFISEDIRQKIVEYESKDTSSSLDSRLLYNILNETLDKMSNQSVLDTFTIKQNFRENLTNILTGMDTLNPRFGRVDEKNACSMINSAVQEIKNKISIKVNQCISNLKIDVKDLLRKAGENNNDVITSKKNEFIQSIENSINETIEKLTIELQDKEHNLHIIENIMNELTKIEDNL